MLHKIDEIYFHLTQNKFKAIYFFPKYYINKLTVLKNIRNNSEKLKDRVGCQSCDYEEKLKAWPININALRNGKYGCKSHTAESEWNE